jgi:hypothetical protein
MATHLRLVLVSVVITRWSKYVFVFLLLFKLYVLLLMIINICVEFSQKENR